MYILSIEITLFFMNTLFTALSTAQAKIKLIYAMEMFEMINIAAFSNFQYNPNIYIYISQQNFASFRSFFL